MNVINFVSVLNILGLTLNKKIYGLFQKLKKRKYMTVKSNNEALMTLNFL